MIVVGCLARESVKSEKARIVKNEKMGLLVLTKPSFGSNRFGRLFDDVRPKAFRSFVLPQTKTGLSNRPNHARVWCFRFAMSENMSTQNKIWRQQNLS